jgi:hypothetical protein
MDAIPRLDFEIDEELPASSLLYTFGGAEPVASVAPGTLISTRTRDAFAGVLQHPGQLLSQVADSRFLNPQTGPFFVEGAQLGTRWRFTSSTSFHASSGASAPRSLFSVP